jgi:hypothetical protein
VTAERCVVTAMANTKPCADIENSAPAMINCPRKDTRYVSFRESLMLEVDPAHATPPLAAFCFMTGFMSVPLSLSLSPL